MHIKAEHHGWYLTALFVSLTLLNVFLAEKHKNNPSQALTCHVLAGPPRRAAAAISLSFFHKLLYRPFTCAENIHTSSHAESASSRWKMESTFSPLSAGGWGGVHLFALFAIKIFKCFPDWVPAAAVWRRRRRRRGSCLGTVSSVRETINKRPLRAVPGRRGRAPTGLLPLSSMPPLLVWTFTC